VWNIYELYTQSINQERERERESFLRKVFHLLQDPASDERFHVELHFSPGAYTVGQDMKDPAGPGFKSQMKEHEKKVRQILPTIY